MSAQARVLIVDDEPQIRRVMKTSLAANGYEVFEARTGEEALAALRASAPDLVLLDMNMPGMGGMAACRELRAVSEVAIIVLSVRDSERDKPFSVNELLARIRANLRRLPNQAEQSQPPFVSEDLTVDFATRQVTSRGNPVRLTPKEFELLQHLVANANKPVTHRKLLQTLWGPDYGDEVEYLRVFVSQLRKKLEADPAHPRYIVTEPWVGYRFAAPPSKQ
jgi:two-component system KDP operon response regulator KdpE